MHDREAMLEEENRRLRRIIADTLAEVRRMGAADQEPQTRGWSAHLQAVPLCEAPRLLGEAPGFTRHTGGPGVISPATFDGR